MSRGPKTIRISPTHDRTTDGSWFATRIRQSWAGFGSLNSLNLTGLSLALLGIKMRQGKKVFLTVLTVYSPCRPETFTSSLSFSCPCQHVWLCSCVVVYIGNESGWNKKWPHQVFIVPLLVTCTRMCQWRREIKMIAQCSVGSQCLWENHWATRIERDDLS